MRVVERASPYLEPRCILNMHTDPEVTAGPTVDELAVGGVMRRTKLGLRSPTNFETVGYCIVGPHVLKQKVMGIGYGDVVRGYLAWVAIRAIAVNGEVVDLKT